MTEKKKYDSTLARMAGNIAGSIAASSAHLQCDGSRRLIANTAVQLARAIVEQLEQEALDAAQPGN